MLTNRPVRIWPMIDDAGLRWPSRYFAFWPLDAVAAEIASHEELSPALSDLLDTIRQQTVEDFRCNPPDWILVDKFAAPQTPDFDILKAFQENQDFAVLLQHYDMIRDVPLYQL